MQDFMRKASDHIDVALKIVALCLAGAALFFPLLDVTFLTQRGTIRSEPLDSLLWLLPLVLVNSLVAPLLRLLRDRIRLLDRVTVSVAVLFSILLVIGLVVMSTLTVIGSAVSLPFASIAVGIDSAVREADAVSLDELAASEASGVSLGIGGWLLLASTAVCLIRAFRGRPRREPATSVPRS